MAGDQKLEVEEELTVDKLVSGDQPSVVILGMLGAKAIKEQQIAIFMVDALNRVCIMPASSVKVLRRPRIPDEDLDSMTEQEAIQVMISQGDSEDEIISYLKRRDSRAGQVL